MMALNVNRKHDNDYLKKCSLEDQMINYHARKRRTIRDILADRF